MREVTTPMSRRAAISRKITFCTSLMALMIASGCSSADDGGNLPSNQPEAPQAAANPGGQAPASKVLPASTPIFDDESKMKVVAQIGLENRVIRFFESEEGELLEVEMALPGAVLDPKEAGLSGSALYAYLTKGEAPKALLEAERHVHEVAARNGVEVAKESKNLTDVGDVTAEANKTPARGAPGLRTAAEWDEGAYTPVYASESYFLNKYCTQTDRFWSCGGTPGLICVGNSRWHDTGVNMVQAGGWSGSGTHYMYVEFAGEYRNITLYQGRVYGWRRTSGINRSPTSKVDFGGSGWYRHCVNFHY